MSDAIANQGADPGTVRKLWPTETDKFRDHMLRLDKESRRMRFAHSVSDSFIEDYASRMAEFGSVVYGYVADGRVRAAAELRRLGDTWGEEAEAAFSVEKIYQDQGIGSELMGRIVRAARNRGIRRLYMSCLAENSKMQAIARHTRFARCTRPIAACGAATSQLLHCLVADFRDHTVVNVGLDCALRNETPNEGLTAPPRAQQTPRRGNKRRKVRS